MEKYDKFFLDKCPCQGRFVRVNYLSSALVKENLSHFSFTLPRKTCQGKTCQGELAIVYSRQVFLDKSTCQGKLASANEALVAHRWFASNPRSLDTQKTMLQCAIACGRN